MSGENDDLLYPSDTGALLFPDLTDNGEELDFTKDFFSDDPNESHHDLNGSTYESMGGDDLIAGFSDEQDVFSRLGASELVDGPSPFGVDVDRKAGMPLSSPTHSKPFANGQILPTYGNFQKPSISLAHMSTGGFSGSVAVSDIYNMHRNGITGLASPTSPSLLSPGATSEKLNSLSLEHHQIASTLRPAYRQAQFDAKGNVVGRGFSKVGGPYSPGSVHNAGEKRFPSSPLSSPSVLQANSNGLLPYSSCGGQDMATGIVVGSDVMHSSPTLVSVRSADGASPRSLVSSNSADAKDAVETMLGAVDSSSGLKISQIKPLFLSSPGLAHRLGSAVDNTGFSSQVDASGDGLRPLSMHPHPSRASAMQRSYSSHALGAHGNDLSGSFRISAADVPSRLSNGSGSPHMQAQSSELQNIHIRPLMQSMRRVHSTGDIETLNGLAGGGTSPSSLERSSYEDGGFKIGRYTMEERKIRIHRYQQKRTQRNFNKKIKYACRKTLADSRPRVRGRFAKNDEVGEPLVKHENKEEDEEEDNHMYEDEEFFVDEDSSGDLSDVLGRSGVKLEHPPTKGIKLEHHHNVDRNLLQT